MPSTKALPAADEERHVGAERQRRAAAAARAASPGPRGGSAPAAWWRRRSCRRPGRRPRARACRSRCRRRAACRWPAAGRARRAGTGRRPAAASPRSWRAQAAVVAALEVQRVAPVDQHEQRLQQVVAVGAPADDVQEQVQLGRRRHVVERAQRSSACSRAVELDPHRRPAAAARASAATAPSAKRREVDAPAELLEAGARGLRRARRAGPRPAAQPVEPGLDRHALAEHLARQRVEVGEAAARPAASTSTTSPGCQRACASMLPSGVDRPSAPATRVAAQVEGGGQRAGRRRADRLDAHAEPAGERVAAGDRRGRLDAGAAGEQHSGKQRRADASSAGRVAERGATPRRITGRPAAGPASRAARRWRRRATRPSRQILRASSRLADAPQHLAEVRGDLRVGPRLVGACAAARIASSRLPRRYSTQPRLSVMNGSPGLSSSAFWISSRASGRRSLRSASE